MEPNHAQQIVKAVTALRTSLLVVVTRVDDLCDLIERAPLAEPELLAFSARADGRQLRLTRSTYSLHWDGRDCALGHTKAFFVMERLCRRPNEYIRVDRLIDELWSGERTYSTLRSTVCRLKAKLAKAGMNDLADMIDGRTHGHYRLHLERD